MTTLRRVALCVAAAVACTSPGDAGRSPSPRQAEPTLPPPHVPLRVVATGAVDAVGAVRWDYARAVSSTEIHVYFVGGTPECDLLADVRVAETSSTVTVTVSTGRPAGRREPCHAIGFPARTRVPLSAPIGSRRLLDGAVTPPEARELRP